jgi:hypothetical protein
VLGLSLLGFGLGEATAALTGVALPTMGNLHVTWDAAYIVVLQGLSHAFRR